MRKTAPLIKAITLSTIIIGAFWMFWKIGTTTLYTEYDTLWNYRRLHPEFQPDQKTEKILSFGNQNTYAGISWIKLIQFIGDNIGNGKYLTFTHSILSHITALNPYFSRAYELDLVMAPLIYPDSDKETLAKNESLMREILAHGEKGINTLCEKEKIDEIKTLPTTQELWSNTSLRNPCRNGMIPYYMAYHYGNVFHDSNSSEFYYKIASMQDDAPKASEFLSILAKANEWDYIDSALWFFLIASEWYDIPPYACRELASNLAKDIINKQPMNQEWINSIEILEKKLKDQKDSSIPESVATTNCFDSTERGIKQLYTAYIAKIAEEYPHIKDSQELVKNHILPHTPTIQSQSGFILKKNDEWIWRYRMIVQ